MICCAQHGSARKIGRHRHHHDRRAGSAWADDNVSAVRRGAVSGMGSSRFRHHARCVSSGLLEGRAVSAGERVETAAAERR